MADQETGNEVTYENHPLFRTAMKLLAEGDEAGAIGKLQRLARLYPREPALQDLLVRTELRAALVASGPISAGYRGPTPFLRRALLLLLLLTIGLVVIVGFAAAYRRIVSPVRENREQELRIASLRQEGQERLAAGDWSGARSVLEELLTLVPGDPTAQAGIETSRQQEELDRLYASALAAQQQGNRPAALATLRQIQAQSPEYRDVPQRIKNLEAEESLELSWQQAQNYAQAGDWPGTISLLTQIRAQNPNFRRDQVEEQLFQAYVALARLQIAQAGGNLDLLRQAVGYMDQALALQPTNQGLIEERRMAASYVAGFDAFSREDWTGAVSQWEPVFDAQPDYQNGSLRGVLYQAYPPAAKKLIAQANGSLAMLRQAIGYLDRVLAVQPDNQELAEERRLAAAYVTGAEAFARQEWDDAVASWGPIYAARRDYQNGGLEKNLRQACANSLKPDPALCPP